MALIAGRLRELVDARLVLIALPDTAESLRIAAAEGDGTYGIAGMRLEFAGSKAGRVLERGRSERVDSVLEDPEIDQQAARRLGVHSALFVPLVAKSRPIGVVIVHDKAGPTPVFSDDDMRLVEALADRAATAVDLSQRVGRDVVGRVVAAQELERQRLARELHDETGQALTSILLGLKPIERIATDDESRLAVASLRELVVSHAPERPTPGRRATSRRARRLRAGAGARKARRDVSRPDADRPRLRGDARRRTPPERSGEATIYRLVQEALSNIVKHASASRVSVLLTMKNGAVAAVIEDDGRGFDPATVGDDGLGLLGMRERVGLLGGRLRVESGPAGGVTLVAEVPLP